LILDVTFGEDACRYALHAPHNLALLRRFAVNALNRAGSSKQSLRQKSRAAMDDCFMLRVLAAALPDPNEDENPCCQ